MPVPGHRAPRLNARRAPSHADAARKRSNARCSPNGSPRTPTASPSWDHRCRVGPLLCMTAARTPQATLSSQTSAPARSSCCGLRVHRHVMHTRPVSMSVKASSVFTRWSFVRNPAAVPPNATPNTSLEGTSTGKALGPRARQCHHRSRGPSALPAPAPQLQR